MPDYGSAAYWDERYAADENASFDWCVAGWRGGLATIGTPDGDLIWDFCRYQTYDALKPHLLPYLRSSDEFEVYIPGCGNSSTYFASDGPVGSTLTHVDQA